MKYLRYWSVRLYGVQGRYASDTVCTTLVWFRSQESQLTTRWAVISEDTQEA